VPNENLDILRFVPGRRICCILDLPLISSPRSPTHLFATLVVTAKFTEEQQGVEPVGELPTECAKQTWPDFVAACLRSSAAF
jgi:hypothetical protein